MPARGISVTRSRALLLMNSVSENAPVKIGEKAMTIAALSDPGTRARVSSGWKNRECVQIESTTRVLIDGLVMTTVRSTVVPRATESKSTDSWSGTITG